MKKIELVKDAKLSKLRQGLEAFAILKDGKAIGHAFKNARGSYRWAHLCGNEAAILAAAASF
jgi:hypothetical protein